MANQHRLENNAFIYTLYFAQGQFNIKIPSLKQVLDKVHIDLSVSKSRELAYFSHNRPEHAQYFSRPRCFLHTYHWIEQALLGDDLFPNQFCTLEEPLPRSCYAIEVKCAEGCGGARAVKRCHMPVTRTSYRLGRLVEPLLRQAHHCDFEYITVPPIIFIFEQRVFYT